MADRVMRAVALIEAHDKTQKAFASVAAGAEKLGKTLKLVEKQGAAVNAAMLKAGDVTTLAKARQELTRIANEFRNAQEKASRFGDALKRGGGGAGMAEQYRLAQSEVRRLAAAYDEARGAARRAAVEFRSAHSAARASGGSGGGGAAAAIAPTSLAAYARAKAIGGRRPGAAVAGATVIPFGAGAAGLAMGAYGAKRVHDAVADAHHDYQLAYLRQQAVLGMSPDAQAPLLQQAIRIGQDTKFTNADIVRAQTEIGGKLPKEFQGSGTISAITEATKNYALAMQVSMEEGAQAVVAWMKARGYDLSSPQAASKSAARAANQMVEFAKTSGAKHHDLLGDTKFGAAPGRVGGFSEEFSNALSAQLIRIGYEGAMAGNFVRAAAMRLSAPSNKGHAALAAAGLNFFDYVKPGVDPSAGGLDKMLQQRFGRKMAAGTFSRVKTALDDEETVKDPGAFTSTLTDILTEEFAKKNKKGGVNAMDAERIAKVVTEFFNLSTQGVDSERMMKDIIGKGLSPALAKYLFGQEHGGRAQALNLAQLERDQKNFQNVPENRAQSIADTMQQGAQGEYLKMAGSFETFKVALGEATDGLRSFTYKGIGGFFDAMTKLVKGEPLGQTTLTQAMKGAFWTPTTPEAKADLEGQLKELNAKIDSALSRVHPSRRDEPNPVVDQMRMQATDLQNRIANAKIEAVVKPDQITAKADVKGEATVTHTFTLNFNAGAFQQFLDGRIASQVSKVRLHSNGAGSTGTSSPDSQ